MASAFETVSPDDLEHVVADVWDARGWTTTVTRVSQDGGVDVVAERQNPFPQKQLLQVKHYADDNPVSAPEIQQYAGLQHQHPDADSVVLVTSGRFTEPARETAAEANVKLVGGDELAAMAADAGVLDASGDVDVSTGPSRSRQVVDSVRPDGGSPTRLSDQIIEAIRVAVLLFVFGYMMYTLWDTGLLL